MSFKYSKDTSKGRKRGHKIKKSLTQKQRDDLRRERSSRVRYSSGILDTLTPVEKSIVARLRTTWEGGMYYQAYFTNLFTSKFQDFNIEHFAFSEPTKMKRDRRGRLHCMDGPAITLNSGEEAHLIHGVIITKDFYYKLINKELNVEDILAIRNSEHRAIAMQIYGYQEIIDRLKATREVKILDRQELIHPKFKNRFYEVFEIGERFDTEGVARFVKVVCTSTGKETIIRVPLIEQTRSCAGAIAWTFGLDANTYKPIIET